MARERALRSELRRSFRSCMISAIITQEVYARAVALSQEVAPFVPFAPFCRFAPHGVIVRFAQLVLNAPFGPIAADAHRNAVMRKWLRIGRFTHYALSFPLVKTAQSSEIGRKRETGVRVWIRLAICVSPNRIRVCSGR